MGLAGCRLRIKLRDSLKARCRMKIGSETGTYFDSKAG